MGFIQNIDNSILQLIQDNLRGPIFDNFFVFITKLGGSSLLWLSISIILIFFRKTRKCGILLAVTYISVRLFGDEVLKAMVKRDRPFKAYPLFPISELLIKAPAGFSFPSGHTSSSFGSATAIFLYNKKCGIAAFCFAALIAFSRMYLYVHYPSDILAGIILGVGGCLLLKHLLDYFYKTVKTSQK